MNNYYIDVHVLQTVPPSCVNRDDTGSPKTSIYGGTTRARVSSQAWKHAMREEFKTLFTQEQLGKRTKRIVNLISEKVLQKNSKLDKAKVDNKVLGILKDAGFKMKSVEKGTDALFFMSDKQAEAVGNLYLETDDKKEYKKLVADALRDHPSVDMALFGRMVASDPSLNYDASAQVAHAISTHKIVTEYDYFTAVDDCSPDDNAGAGHLGTVEFNSATLYRYASVNIRELFEYLGDDTAEAARKFVQAFVLSMPTGKQNTFANRTVPDLVYVAIRNDQPVNMSGAFEKAVPDSKNGYLEESINRLSEHTKKVYKDFVDIPSKEYIVGTDSFGKDVTKISFKELLNNLEEDVRVYQEMG